MRAASNGTVGLAQRSTMGGLPLPPEDVVANLPGASPPVPGDEPEDREPEPFVDPVAFLEGLISDRVLRKALHPSARAAVESIAVSVAYKGTDSPLAVATSLLKVGEILRAAAERRERALALAAESFRVALALFGEAVGRDHHVTLKARMALGETLAAANRRPEAAVEFETIIETLAEQDPESPRLETARRNLAKLDAHPTLAATMHRATRKDREKKGAGIEKEDPVLYGRFAGRDPPADGDALPLDAAPAADAPPKPWAPPDPDADAPDPTKLGLELDPFMSANDIRRQRLRKKWAQIEGLRNDAPILYGRYTGKTPPLDGDDPDGDGEDEAAALDHLPGRLVLAET